MTDLFNQIRADRSPMQRLMAHLPGFHGYQASTDRRAADRLIREHVVAGLRMQLNALVAAQKTVLSSSGGLAHMSKLHDVQSQFQVFIDRVNAAMPGYAGFYDAIKVHPDDLQKLYTFDAALVEYVDQFKTAVAALQTAANTNEGLDTAISALQSLISDANATFNQRDSVITGIK
ncbi:MAG: hypothetical protein ACYDBJ_21915 [Aggregatilineales bacterium]